MTPSLQSRASLLVLGSVLLWSHVAAGASFARADKKGPAKLTCPKGAFMDPRLDDWSKGPECWSCPKGYGRTAEPVTSDKACLREGGEVFDKADKVGKWTCNKKQDEFFDPRKGGECWSCPSKTPRRTLYAVTSDKACASKIGVLPEKLSKANFEHKWKGCAEGAFPHGEECWKCPKGHTRTLEDIKSKKACVKTRQDSFKDADREGSWGCDKGSFFDPQNGGECWACPTSHPFRTVNPVSGGKACTDQLLSVFAVEDKAMCEAVIDALNAGLRDGQKGYAKLEELTRPVISPVMATLQEPVDKAGDLLDDTAAIEQVLAKFDTQALDKTAAFAREVGKATGGIKDVLLSKSICSPDPRKIDDSLKKVLTLPAGFDRQFFSVSAGATFAHPTYRASMSVAVTWVTNLGGQGGLFMSIGLGATTSEEPASFGVGAMYFPGAKLDDFGLSAVPGMTVSVAKGPAFEKLFKGKEALLPLVSVIDGIDVAWSPEAPAVLPTLGVSRGVVGTGGGQAPIDLSASIGWDFPLLTYKDYKLQ